MSPFRLRLATKDDLADIVDLSTAAFDPSTDTIVAALFPPHLRVSGGHNSQSVRDLRIARKTFRFSTSRSVMMVATDDALDGKIVGYACWEKPVGEGGEGGGEGQDGDLRPPKMDHPELDLGALAELIRVMELDAHTSYGERGTQDVWCKAFGISLRSNVGCANHSLQASAPWASTLSTGREALAKWCWIGACSKQMQTARKSTWCLRRQDSLFTDLRDSKT